MLYIIYRDELGTVRDEVEGAVCFLNGRAYFVANGKDIMISVKNVVEIGKIGTEELI